MKIKSICVINQNGETLYRVGNELNGVEIAEITLDVERYTGDPYSQYFVLDAQGNRLAMLSPFAPLVIEYCHQPAKQGEVG